MMLSSGAKTETEIGTRCLWSHTDLRIESWFHHQEGEVEILVNYHLMGEGNGTLLQHSCLENPMDGGAW